MGCCISKCKSKRKRPDVNPSDIQDKTVISQSPLPPSPPPKRRNIQSPPPPSSTSSITSSYQSSSTCGSSSLSSASSSSSVGFSKVERSFSNDFLQSCVKENPQIVVLDPNKNNIRETKQLIPGCTQKRARASSPTLTRQKSIRVEKERVPNIYLNGRSNMRSPSPSRRFNGYTSNYQRPPILYTTSENKCVVKANSRPASPNRNVISKERPMYVIKNKQKYGHGIGSKVEGVEVGEVFSKVNYSGPVAMTDIDNAHVALDCFIFL